MFVLGTHRLERQTADLLSNLLSLSQPVSDVENGFLCSSCPEAWGI